MKHAFRGDSNPGKSLIEVLLTAAYETDADGLHGR